MYPPDPLSQRPRAYKGLTDSYFFSFRSSKLNKTRILRNNEFFREIRSSFHFFKNRESTLLPLPYYPLGSREKAKTEQKNVVLYRMYVLTLLSSYLYVVMNFN